ncbi:ATP-binding protein [Sphingobium sp. HBC34]|uniref:histidine kinase n=1 Tax=Sphingobium cyanobacteriorum TaxID=3063954 RepID=A0ABT8ZP19_9SPHN|nr:ATP-binding protein [Sphingobium sp. HBC34]MDO7836263.1 ATP-binding protein [Sphingobium sp. HBC34]
MAALSIVTIITSTAAFYFIYALLERWRIVAPMPAGIEDTTGLDVGITLGVCVLGLLLALAVAVWLARRIVRPLAAVGAAARQIASGDLATRIDTVPDVQGETAMLIADFNAMADRLQQMAEDVSIWNAQIAHELRTPLTILQGRLQGAKDGLFPLDETLVEALLTQVAGLTRLVEDLRSVSLADSGRLELLLSDVDLAGEIQDMAPTLRAMLEPSGFSLALDLAAGTVLADASRLRQAILALVDNAHRHADPCILSIATRFTSGHVTITVADTGPGLHPDIEHSAFRQFVRGPLSSGGTGLGLAVVRGIARAHGGDVRYRREDGVSAFDISLDSIAAPIFSSR